MSGHVEHNFRQPLPANLRQCNWSWAAYLATTGLSSIDYVITDPLWPPSSGAAAVLESSSPVICPTALWCTKPYLRNPAAQTGTRLTPSPQPSAAPRLGDIRQRHQPGATDPKHCHAVDAVLCSMPCLTRLKLECNCSPDIVKALFIAGGVSNTHRSQGTHGRHAASVLSRHRHCPGWARPVMAAPPAWTLYGWGAPGHTARKRHGVPTGRPSFLTQWDEATGLPTVRDEFVTIASALAADLPALEHARQTLRPAIQASPL